VGIREILNYANEYGTNLLTIGSGRYSTPQNAMTLDWYGNARFDGDVYV
jgi:hypothetical protein